MCAIPRSEEPRQRGEQVRPPIVVSRTHPDLIRRLFEIEVPEIYDGMVEIVDRLASPAPARRWRSRPESPTLIRSARASGRRAAASAWSSKSSATSASTSSSGAPTRDLRGQLPFPGEGLACFHRRREPLRDRRRSRRPAFARHRQGGSKRPSRGAFDRLAHRHQVVELPSEPLPTENMLIDEDDLDDVELCAYESEDGARCRNHARPAAATAASMPISTTRAFKRRREGDGRETIKKQRSCIGCMSQGTKRSLHRIVRSSEGSSPSTRLDARRAAVPMCARGSASPLHARRKS